MENKIIMDTNVAAKAATPLQDCKDEELDMRRACIEFIQNLTRNPESKLVLDIDQEIMTEYRHIIPNETNEGKLFWRWLYTYLGKIDLENLIKLEKDEDGNYLMFPMEERTREFDLSDRKFVALSCTHAEHPPIVEAADGKWLGFKEVFEEYGVHIEFLDMNYANMMYDRKVLNKRRN